MRGLSPSGGGRGYCHARCPWDRRRPSCHTCALPASSARAASPNSVITDSTARLKPFITQVPMSQAGSSRAEPPLHDGPAREGPSAAPLQPLGAQPQPPKGKRKYAPRNMFTDEDDEAIRRHVRKFGEGEWPRLCTELGRSSPQSVRNRWSLHLSPAAVALRKAAAPPSCTLWTEPEDNTVRVAVKEHGAGSEAWEAAAAQLPKRSWSSVSNRWTEHLSPDAVGASSGKPWTDAEDEILRAAVERHGSGREAWDVAADQLKGRHAEAARKRWQYLIERSSCGVPLEAAIAAFAKVSDANLDAAHAALPSAVWIVLRTSPSTPAETVERVRSAVESEGLVEARRCRRQRSTTRSPHRPDRSVRCRRR